MLAEILAEPDDVELRLIYADQLLAAGDPRGEYIVVETRLEQAERGTEARAALARRRAELRMAHGAAWWPELPEQRVGTRGGFVDRVAVFSSELDSVARLADRETIEAIELLDFGQAPLRHAPWQDRVRRLVVHDSLRAQRVEWLWESRLCESVEDVTVMGPSVTEWQPLGDRLPRCRRLCFQRPFINELMGEETWAPLRVLSGWKHLSRLEVLELRSCIGGPSALHYVAALELPSLRELRIWGPCVTEEGSGAVATRARAWPALKRLALFGVRADLPAIAQLRAERPDLELCLEEPPEPDRIAIDAMGVELELIRVDGADWAVAIDGARRPIRTGGDVVEHVRFGRVVRALTRGETRLLGDGAIGVPISEGHDIGLVIARDRSELRL